MIKAVIFDLDNCLAAANEPGEELFAPAFEAIREANRGTLTEAALNAAFADCWVNPLDAVAARHGFSGGMVAAGWREMVRAEVREPMRGYPDLPVLEELPVQRFLVTSGFRRLQESKVKALGFEELFEAIHIDAIDDVERKGKHGIFEEILSGHELKPAETLVVGDNPESEIAVGNRLGIGTVQILRPGVPRGETAKHHISTLAELKELLARSNGK